MNSFVKKGGEPPPAKAQRNRGASASVAKEADIAMGDEPSSDRANLAAVARCATEAMAAVRSLQAAVYLTFIFPVNAINSQFPWEATQLRLALSGLAGRRGAPRERKGRWARLVTLG